MVAGTFPCPASFSLLGGNLTVGNVVEKADREQITM